MLRHLVTLMAFQLAGETLVSSMGLPFPGPLLGMLLLLGCLQASGGPGDGLSLISFALIDHLGLFFVPAGTAIIAFWGLMRADAPAILASIVLSTVVAILVTGFIAKVRAEW
jgi:holin-like protein